MGLPVSGLRIGGQHMTRIIGIDPGQTGAIAAIYDDGPLGVWDMPTIARRNGGQEINAAQVAAILRHISCSNSDWRVVLEQVSAMPGQGVTSMFRFGEGFGIVKGVVAALGLPLETVTPQKWKRAAGLIGADKDHARTLAIQRFPAAAEHLTRKKDVGRADAILIADYIRERG